MNETTRSAILAHAAAEAPKECCGLVVNRRGKEIYRPARNLAPEPEKHFVLDPEAYAAAEEEGDVLAVVHSHPVTNPSPTQPDRVACEASGLPWIICNPATGQCVEFAPSGYTAPLVGRTFAFGILDCFALVRDYYAGLGVQIADVPRQDGCFGRGENLILDSYRARGFTALGQDAALKEHDVIVIQAGNDPVPNHLAVYLDGDIILHHFRNRLSCREVYGGYWAKCTVNVLRYEAWL